MNQYKVIYTLNEELHFSTIDAENEHEAASRVFESVSDMYPDCDYEYMDTELVDNQDNSQYNINEDIERSFVETSEFTKQWEKFGFNDEDLTILQNDILQEKGWIPLGGSVYKIRFSPRNLNKGKSNSDRVMFADIIKQEKIYLLDVFSKGDQANISNTELRLLKQAADMFGGKSA